MVKIGNAPVSYGAFEVTVGKHESAPTAAEVLDAVQAAGYEGIDLGPLGYLGLGNALRSALSSRGLLLTGGYAQDSVIQVLVTTDAWLCLDTGHLVAAGGNPLAILDRWQDRVAHVHLKDARPADWPFTEAMQLWEGDIFCRLGAGRGRVDEVLGSLRAGGYEGWIVVEQDVLPRSRQAYQQASADQQQNREYVRNRGWQPAR